MEAGTIVRVIKVRHLMSSRAGARFYTVQCGSWGPVNALRSDIGVIIMRVSPSS